MTGRAAVVGLASIVAFSLGCGSSGELTGEPAAASEADRTVEVTTTEYSFEPDRIEVEAGETIEFRISNEGEEDHELALGLIQHGAGHMGHMMAMDNHTAAISSGEEASLTWSFTEPGEIQFACHIDGHDDRGMAGTIVVTE